MIRLMRCESCSRHVRANEVACPFCKSRLEPAADAPTPKRARGLSRAQRMALVAAFAGESLVACGNSITPYGAPPPPPSGSSGPVVPSRTRAGVGADAAGSSGADAGPQADGGPSKR